MGSGGRQIHPTGCVTPSPQELVRAGLPSLRPLGLVRLAHHCNRRLPYGLVMPPSESNSYSPACTDIHQSTKLNTEVHTDTCAHPCTHLNPCTCAKLNTCTHMHDNCMVKMFIQLHPGMYVIHSHRHAHTHEHTFTHGHENTQRLTGMCT